MQVKLLNNTGYEKELEIGKIYDCKLKQSYFRTEDGHCISVNKFVINNITLDTYRFYEDTGAVEINVEV